MVEFALEPKVVLFEVGRWIGLDLADKGRLHSKASKMCAEWLRLALPELPADDRVVSLAHQFTDEEDTHLFVTVLASVPALTTCRLFELKELQHCAKSHSLAAMAIQTAVVLLPPRHVVEERLWLASQQQEIADSATSGKLPTAQFDKVMKVREAASLNVAELRALAAQRRL